MRERYDDAAPHNGSYVAALAARASDAATRDARALLWIPTPEKAAGGRRGDRGGGSAEAWSYARVASAAHAAASRLHALVPALRTSIPPDLSPHLAPDCRARTVGVLVDEGAALAVAFAAIHVAGAAFVPLSARDPATRLRDAIEDAACVAVIADRANDVIAGAAERLAEAIAASARPRAVAVVDVSEVFAPEDGTSTCVADSDFDFAARPEWRPRASALSHVYFTSGSTGRPKGCLATHGQLARYARAKNEAHGVDEGSVVLVASPPTFDPFAGDLAATWSAGATVAMCPRASLFASLGRCLEASRATHALTTPAMLRTVPGVVSDASDTAPGGGRFEALRTLALGGEPTPASLAAAWRPRTRALANTYGVTECCVYQAFHEISAAPAAGEDGESSFSASSASLRGLGAPLGECRFIFAREPGDDPDDRLPERSPPGAVELAELWIAGPTVGRGYANAPALTEERFRVDGDGDGDGDGEYGLCFRTGDIVRRAWPADGGACVVEIVGRRDAQVKINGQRVELGEIERATVSAAPAMATAAAVALAPARELHGGGLVAWFVPTWPLGDDDDASVDVPSSPGALACDAMRWLLSGRVPRHMLPRLFAVARELPMTSSGKVSRRALLERGLPPPPDRGAGGGGGATRGGLGRSKAFASVVARAWTSALGGVAVDRASHFAELGGDSLAALRACQELHAVFRAAAGGGDFGDGRETETETEDVGAFGEALAGALAPAKLLQRPTLGAYVRFLQDAADAGELPGAAAILARDEEEEEEEASGSDDGDGDARDDEEKDEGVALLFRAAADASPASSRVARALLDAGVPVDGRSSRRDGSHLTPLHVACGAGPRAEDTARTLVAAGADRRARTRRGRTPFLVAAARGSVALLAALLEGAAGTADVSAIVDAVDEDGQTALHVAARAGAAGAVLDFICDVSEGGAPPGAAAKKKPSAKKPSAKKPAATSKSTKPPITRRADVWGRTPLHWASVNGHRAACDALTRRGADVGAVDAFGETPVDAAERRALCAAKDRPDGERASRWGDIATALGGSGRTKHLRAKSRARGE